MHVRPSSRSTFGEALIALAGLAGMMIAVHDGAFAPVSFWLFAQLFGLVTVFYFSLLFARMLFFWMTGGESNGNPWWAEMAAKEAERNAAERSAKRNAKA